MQVTRYLKACVVGLCGVMVVGGCNRKQGSEPIDTTVSALCANTAASDGAVVRIHGVVRTDRRDLALLLDKADGKDGIVLIVPERLRKQEAGAKLMALMFSPTKKGVERHVHGEFVGRFELYHGLRRVILDRVTNMSVDDVEDEGAGRR